MDTSRIQEIILKVNGNDAENTINRIKSVIKTLCLLDFFSLAVIEIKFLLTAMGLKP